MLKFADLIEATLNCLQDFPAFLDCWQTMRHFTFRTVSQNSAVRFHTFPLSPSRYQASAFPFTASHQIQNTKKTIQQFHISHMSTNNDEELQNTTLKVEAEPFIQKVDPEEQKKTIQTKPIENPLTSYSNQQQTAKPKPGEGPHHLTTYTKTASMAARKMYVASYGCRENFLSAYNRSKSDVARSEKAIAGAGVIMVFLGTAMSTAAGTYASAGSADASQVAAYINYAHVALQVLNGLLIAVCQIVISSLGETIKNVEADRLYDLCYHESVKYGTTDDVKNAAYDNDGIDIESGDGIATGLVKQ